MVLLATIGYAFFTIRGPHGIPALMQKRRQIGELEQRNAALHRQVEHKRNRIQRLRDNQAAQEMEIRERLKLVRPGEKVFVLPDHKSATPGGQ